MTQAIGPLSGGKVQSRHRERLAIVYVRQSTLQQVARHQETVKEFPSPPLHPKSPHVDQAEARVDTGNFRGHGRKSTAA